MKFEEFKKYILSKLEYIKDYDSETLEDWLSDLQEVIEESD